LGGRSVSFSFMESVIRPAAIKAIPPLMREKMQDEMYLNRWVRWRAVISSVGRSLWGGYSLMLHDAIDISERPGTFFAYFADEVAPALERVREGDIIDIEGRIYTFANDEIDIDHCEIISHEIAAPPNSG
jgi:hypothetical protein